MGFLFPFLCANDLRSSLLNIRARSLSYVGLFLNLIANAVNNNNQNVRSGKKYVFHKTLAKEEKVWARGQ